MSVKLKKLLHWFRERINYYNAFIPDENEYDDTLNESENQLTIVKHQLYATRLYIPLLIITVYIITFVTIITPQTELITVSNIDESLFNKLYHKHANSLSCLCSTTAVPYANFTTHTISFHPICSSVYVREEWIKALYLSHSSTFLVMDFRTSASSQFELLAALCQISQNTVAQSMSEFDNKQFITVELLTEDKVHSQVMAYVNFMRTNIPTEVTTPLEYLQIITQSNRMITALNTNIHVQIDYDDSDESVYSLEPQTTYYFDDNVITIASLFNSGCSIKNSIAPADFYPIMSDYQRVRNHIIWPKNPPYWEPVATSIVDGFFGGCNPLDALLASTFNCLYNVSCLKNFIDYFPGLNQTNFNWSDGLPASSRRDISLKSLLNDLLIEEWSPVISYSKYFISCGTTVCTYNRINKMNISYTITFLLGFLGSVTILLRLLSPLLIKMFSKLRYCSFHHSIHFVRNIPKLFMILKQLNMFKSINNQTPFDIHKQRITTRIYLILLTKFRQEIIIVYGAIFILLSFTLSRVQIETKVLTNPSIEKFEYLQSLHSDSLKCPCTSIVIPYKKLMISSPTLHQVCSSDFMSQHWIRLMGFSDDISGIRLAWRGFSVRHFRLLFTLCQLANSSVNDALQRFATQSFITLNAISKDDFNIQTNITFYQFIQLFIINFDLLVNLGQLFTQIDQPYTIGDNAKFIDRPLRNKTNDEHILPLPLHLTGVKTIKTSSVDCICATDPDCQTPVADPVDRYNSVPTDNYYDVPGAVMGCFVLDSLLRSTLECYYSESCLAVHYKYINYSFLLYDTGFSYFKARLLVHDPIGSRFLPNTTLDKIVKELMVEQWHTSFLFDHYYNSCAPIKCMYPEEISANTYVETMVIMISSIGGLIAAFRLISTLLVTIYFRLFKNGNDQSQKNHNHVHLSSFERIRMKSRMVFKKLHILLINLNIFPLRTFGRHFDQRKAMYFGKLTTRLYIVLMLISITILTFYNGIKPRTLINIFENPTHNIYERLLITHGDTLQCPCSVISLTYRQFVNIQPVFHPVCTSPFISDEWRRNITTNLVPDLSVYSNRDYRRFLSSHLQFLSQLCYRSMKSVNNSIDHFLSSYFVSKLLLPNNKLQAEINLFINQNKLNTPVSFMRYFSLIRSVNHGNAIVSAYESNYIFVNPWINESKSVAITKAISYDGNCSCALNLNCTIQAEFVQNNSDENIKIKGLKMGCTPTEAYLASTLECFYDSDCIHLMLENINNTNSFIDVNTHSSLRMNNSRFLMNTTILNLINDLFIENWLTTIDYSTYFNQCLPTSCSYTYTQKLNSFYTLTIILGLFGGLSFVLKWICPKIILLVLKLDQYNKKRNNIISIATVTTENSMAISNASGSQMIPTNSSSLRPSTTSIHYYFLFGIILFIFLIAIAIVLTILMNRQINSFHTITSMLTTSTPRMTTNDPNISTATTVSASLALLCPLTFQQLALFTIGSIERLSSIGTGDFNNDTYLDLAVVGARGSTTYTIEERVDTIPLIVADLNNDDRVDIGVFLARSIRQIGTYISNGDGTFQSLATFPISPSNKPHFGFTVGYFNNDDYLDVVVFDRGLSIIYGSSNGIVNAVELIITNSISIPSFIGSGDFNNDHQMDLGILDDLHDELQIVLNNGDGDFQQSILLSFDPFSSPNSFAVGNFNNDHHLDLVVANHRKHNIVILLGNNNGTFEKQIVLSTGSYSGPYLVLVDDFNNDNRSDIAVTLSNLHAIGFWVGLGDGTFLPQITFSTGTRSIPNVFVKGDLNNDGKLDVVILDTESTNLVILMNTCSC
ncbi:unnamed protein product [Adineta ricciae]|uniref:Uncharacterized protein n=1 Tax=Adineta ricciae TaxID=249248 RepID=A0A815NUI3_ADIRI|nr:unnamed protein product [Adineta ricciae]